MASGRESSLLKPWTILLMAFAMNSVSDSQLMASLVSSGSKSVEMNLSLPSSGTKCQSQDPVRFFLYTRAKPADPGQMISAGTPALQGSGFFPIRPTKMIVHGFYDSMQRSKWMQEMKNALLNEGDYNVILVDWSCRNGFPYESAIANSKITAQKMKELIEFLMISSGVSAPSIHLIGHGLGAHISGECGSMVSNLGRISGLDPSGPLFYTAAPKDRLDSSDAMFVDVIHTNGGENLVEGFGFLPPAGHVDFYPNGGKKQPGCVVKPPTSDQLADLLRGPVSETAAYDALACNHLSAVHLYTDSIVKKDTSCAPLAVSCKSWEVFEGGLCHLCETPGACAVMGYHSDKSMAGTKLPGDENKYFLKTASAAPYCLHQTQVVVDTKCPHCPVGGSGGSSFLSGTLVLQLRVQLPGIIDVGFKLNLTSNLTFNLVRAEAVTNENGEYIFLAATREPVGRVQGASAEWRGPKTQSAKTAAVGVTLGKIKMHPIALGPRSVIPETILCGPLLKALRNNEKIDLAINTC